MNGRHAWMNRRLGAGEWAIRGGRRSGMDGCAAMRGWTGESVWMNRRLGAGEWTIRGIGISSLKYHIAIIFISYFKSQIIFQISGQNQRALLHG